MSESRKRSAAVLDRSNDSGNNEDDLESLAKEELILRLRRAEEQVKEQRRQAEEQRRQVEEQRRLRRLLNGTYYAQIQEVWQPKPVEFSEQHCSILKREQCPDFHLRNRGFRITYETTLEAAKDCNLSIAASKSRSRSSHTSTSDKQLTWPVNIFGNGIGQISHLLPAASSKAALYDDVVTWVFALEQTNERDDWDKLKQKLIHGSRPKKREENERVQKTRHTGLKHCVANKIRLQSQQDFYDNVPCVLIVPVMSLDDAKQWKGGSYEAVVMAGEHPNGETNRTKISDICSAIDMHDLPALEASVADVNAAGGLLGSVIQGLAYSLRCKNAAKLPENADTFWGTARELLIELQSRFSAFLAEHSQMVFVPKQISRLPEGKIVRKVAFAAHEEESGHPAPDPLLLTVKAAVNWSARHDFPLLAAGGDQDDVDSLDQQAEEEFLEYRKELRRPKTLEDLARGLHQPNGYQG